MDSKIVTSERNKSVDVSTINVHVILHMLFLLHNVPIHVIRIAQANLES